MPRATLYGPVWTAGVQRKRPLGSRIARHMVQEFCPSPAAELEHPHVGFIQDFVTCFEDQGLSGAELAGYFTYLGGG